MMAQGFKLRMPDELREAVEQSAEQSGKSLNSEIVDRLQSTFRQEAQVGGPVMLGITNLMAGAFLRGGHFAAAASGHPEWTVEQWLADPFCHRAACLAVGQALSLPLPTRAEMDDPRAVSDLFTSMIARGMPITRTEQDK
jgi:hypothetical protein